MAASLRMAAAQKDAALAERARRALNVAREETTRNVLWYASRAAVVWELN